MMPVLAFGIALAVASLLAFRHGGEALRRTAIVLAVNWSFIVTWELASGVLDAWMVFAAVDAVSAFLILQHPASRPQAVIGVIYIVQITVHLAYALVSDAAATALYLNMLAGGGWLQIATLAAGALHNGPGRRMLSHLGMGGDRPRLAETHIKRMGQD